MHRVTSLRSRRLAAAGAALLLLCSPPAVARTDPALTAFFSRVNSAVTSLAGKTGGAAYSGCLTLVRSLIDMDAVARQVAAEAWARMTPRQRSAFQVALERRAARNCTSQNKNNSGEAITLLGTREGSNGDRLLATGVSQQNGAARTAIWRIPKRGSRAVDLLVDGQSTVLSLRNQVAEILARTKGDINAVIDALRH